MIKYLKTHKRDIAIFFFVFIVSLIMCSAFLRPHYTHETYKIINIGYKDYSDLYFLKEGRPFTAMLTMIADLINLKIEIYILLSFISALIFLSLSVVSVYNIFKYKTNNKILNFIFVLVSFITIFNYLALEHVYFIECSIMSLGIFLSVQCAKIIIYDEKNKYVKTFLLGLIVVFCYQGSLAFLPMIVIFYKLFFEKDTLKQNIKDIFKISIIYIILMLLTIIYSKVLFGVTRTQIGAEPFSIIEVWKWAIQLAINSLGVIPPYVHIGYITLTILIIILLMKKTKKEKALYIFKYLFIVIYSVFLSLAPIVGGSGLELTPRTCLAYGCTIGLSLYLMLYIVVENNKKRQMNFISLIVICTFLLNCSIYCIITNQHLVVNRIDKENCEKINKVIETYENKTGVKVTKIASIRRIGTCEYYPGFVHAGTMTRRALNTWPLRETINYYTGRKLQFVVFPKEKYYQYFFGKAYDNFSLEQVVIEGDTLYFYGG